MEEVDFCCDECQCSPSEENPVYEINGEYICRECLEEI